MHCNFPTDTKTDHYHMKAVEDMQYKRILVVAGGHRSQTDDLVDHPHQSGKLHQRGENLVHMHLASIISGQLFSQTFHKLRCYTQQVKICLKTPNGEILYCILMALSHSCTGSGGREQWSDNRGKSGGASSSWPSSSDRSGGSGARWAGDQEVDPA